MMHFLKKLIFRFPGHYFWAVVVASAVGIFRYSTLAENLDAGFVFYEVVSVAGYVTILIGALFTVSYLGAFDLFGYAFSPGRPGESRKYKDYVHYSEQKMQKRAGEGYYFVPYYVVGILLVLLSIVFG